MIPFNPWGDRIVVDPDEVPDEVTTAAGLHIPVDGDIEKVTTGIIVKHGPDVPDHVEVGQRVLHSQYTGMIVKIANHKYKILTPYDILGVLTSEEAVSAE